MTDRLGVAVVGAGMAGRAHTAGLRNAATLYNSSLPEVRLVSIVDIDPQIGARVAKQFGYERTDTDWRAVAADDSIHAVSVVTGNDLHREAVVGLLEAGKHVLCEKPLSNSFQDAEAMVAAAQTAAGIARIGLTFRRSPGLAFIQHLVRSGELGEVVHVRGRYWSEYSADPSLPLTWRHRGGPGSGALGDLGSHVAYLAEFVSDQPIADVSGGRFATVIRTRPESNGCAGLTPEPHGDVQNEDYAAFTAGFGNGAAGTFEVSRVASGYQNGLCMEVFGTRGSALFNQERPVEIQLQIAQGPIAQRGFRRVVLGPEHPYLAGGLPLDAPGAGLGQNEGFLFQARAFLEEVAGVPEADSLPRCASLHEGLRNMHLMRAVTESARAHGAAVAVPPLANVAVNVQERHAAAAGNH